MPDENLFGVLARIEESIRASEGETILARWDFGKAVLDQRVGLQLPNGLGVQICAAVGISERELLRRVRVAEHYDREELADEVRRFRRTWTAIVEAVPRRQRPPQAPRARRRAAVDPDAPPSRATITAADRVVALIAQPEVAAELLARERRDNATHTAQVRVERAQRAEARAQRERDQETQHMQQVLRMRVVRGGADWQELTELFETMADTTRRILALVEGLPVPDELRLRLFDGQLSALQQALLEMREWLTPSREQRSGGLSRSSLIDVP